MSCRRVDANGKHFLILTNVRTDAALKAEWSEFDLSAAIWTVPLDKLKDRKHRSEPMRIPLSPRAVAIVQEMAAVRSSSFVFPSKASDKPFSNMALLTVIRRMNATDDNNWTDPVQGKPIVPHGFRTSLRAWAEEVGRFPHATIEEAMGHAVGNAIERAYRRTDVLELRRELMNAWAAYCEPNPESKIIKSRPMSPLVIK